MNIVYVDVDDTLIRSGTKRLPIPETICKVQELWNAGAHLYCWSMGGGDYARNVCIELHIDHMFLAFLPKPHVCIDDQAITAKLVHPWELDTLEIERDPGL